MALTTTEIALVLEELRPVLRGGWIQRIHQPTDRTVILEIRIPGRTHRLLISCQPDMSRLHIAKSSLLNPPTPPPFCQFLRAHFQGAQIDDIDQVPDDRIVTIHVTGKDGARTILCELIGKNANILALDAERRILRDLLSQRDLIGKLYDPPAKRAASSRGHSTRFTGADGQVFPVSAAIEAYYMEKESTLSFDAIRQTRLRDLKRTLKKEQKRIEMWQTDLAKAMSYRDYARYGELLKANLGSIQKGTDSISVTDYFDDRLPNLTIPLDPTTSAQGNMDDYFRKHRKYLTAERELKPRIVQTERDIETIRLEIRAIEEGNWTPRSGPSFHAQRSERLLRREGRQTDRPRGPFRRFTSADGLSIFVGRNARENEELTFSLAKSDDLWLHARGIAGSHVVVRLERGMDPPPETLRDAATLALHYSDLKKSGKGEVTYTRRKWVKKAKGQASGAVMVTQEKTIYLAVDSKRLTALKGRTSTPNR